MGVRVPSWAVSVMLLKTSDFDQRFFIARIGLKANLSSKSGLAGNLEN